MEKLPYPIKIILTVSILLLFMGCRKPQTGIKDTAFTVTPTATTPQIDEPTERAEVAGLSQAEIATLESLEKVDDYPLYTMHYYANYSQERETRIRDGYQALESTSIAKRNHIMLTSWGCSLFAAQGDSENMVYGRNFDWNYSPAILLFTYPPGGYPSVSMVDIQYLYGSEVARKLTELPIEGRRALLSTPFMPFDGMNLKGLAVGMAAVPGSEMPFDANKVTIDSLSIIRQILDHASTVDEALDILRNFNIDWGNGPPLHYLVADTNGRSVLIEFLDGEMVTLPSNEPWHLATNFLLARAENLDGRCPRYDKIHNRLTEKEGKLTDDAAMDLLADVSQDSTQWSVVYEMSRGVVNVAMGMDYDKVHTIHLQPSSE